MNQGDLPAGYQVHTDPVSGRPYYVNVMTGQTSWNPPPGVSSNQAPVVQSTTASSRSMESDWEERVDPSTGRTFYIDHVNKRTSWEPPSGFNSSKASYAQPPRSQPAFSTGGGTGGPGGNIDTDAELARRLAAQWEAEDESASAVAPSSSFASQGGKDKESKEGKEGWASDADAVQCFLTGTRFSMVQRKHHCRYCGQIFISEGAKRALSSVMRGPIKLEVCKKTSKVPGRGEEQVRVCDICFDQIERGDPVCISKQVALMRSTSERDRQSGAKALADWAAMDPQFAISGIVSALEALRVAELLVVLLQDGGPQTQAATAQLLSAILKYPAHANAVLQGDLVEPLLKSLRGSNVEAKVGSMTALAELTASEIGRAQLRSAQGLDILIEIILSGGNNHKLAEATCQVLANLCEDDTNDWQRLLQNGVTFSLTALLGSSSTSLQEAVLTLLAMLCSHHECREQVADSGCMPSLVVALGSSKSNLQRTALALAQQLSASKRACTAMLDAGVAAPLASMLANSHNSDTEVMAAVLECLQAISAVGMPQAQTAVRNAGAVPHLIQLMSHEQQRVSSVAGALVAELCPGDVRSSEQLFESGGIVMLAEQLHSHSMRSQLQALSALSQLSSSPQQAVAIVDNGCVEAILQLLEHPNQELKSYAAITFGNLCSCNAIPMQQMQHPSVLPHIVMLLSSSNALARAPAAGAVASMLANPSLRQTVFELGGLGSLVKLLQADTDTSYHAVQAVAQLAADERYRQAVATEPGVVELSVLLGSHVQHVQQCALSAIANISFVNSAVPLLAESGALAQLGMLLFNKDEQVQRMCLTAMCNILGGAGTSLARGVDALLQVGGHMALIMQLSSGKAEAQSLAAMSIGHVCKYQPALQAVLSADVVPVLTKLLHSAHPSVQQQAIYALGVLASADEAAASAVQLAGAIAPLTTLLLSTPSPDVKAHLSATLANAVRGDWRQVFNVGGFQALLDVLAVGTEAVQQQVSSSLGEVLQDVHQRRALLSDMNSVSAIVALLSSPNMATQQNAAVALAALSQEASAREVLYRQGTLSHVIRSLTAANARQEEGASMTTMEAAARVAMLRTVAAFAADDRYCSMLRITIQPLVALLQNEDLMVLVHATQAVMSLSRSESNRDALRDAGATRRLCELLLHAEAIVQENAVQGIANLGVDANDASAFLSSGWHLSLISLLSSESLDVQASAAAVRAVVSSLHAVTKAVVLGSLACSESFRKALMSDGGLQPILRLLHAPSLPTRTAAVRALAIMSQQLMSPALPPDDPSTLQLVDALFESSTIPKLIEVLAEEPGQTAAGGDVAERQLIAVLLLLQNLAGGHGRVRPRLVEAGTIEALVGFLQARKPAPQDKSQAYQPTAASHTSSEILGAAGLTLADLVLAPGASQRIAALGNVSALLPLLQSRSSELQAAIARTIGNMVHDAFAPNTFQSAIPILIGLAARPACSVEATYALSNLFALQREEFSDALLAQLAGQLLSSLETLEANAQHGALFLLRQLALHASARRALSSANASARVRAIAAKIRPSEPTVPPRQLELLLGMLSVVVDEEVGTPSAEEPPASSRPPQTQPPSTPPQQVAPPPPAYSLPRQPMYHHPPAPQYMVPPPPPQATPQYPPPSSYPASAAPPLERSPSNHTPPPQQSLAPHQAPQLCQQSSSPAPSTPQYAPPSSFPAPAAPPLEHSPSLAPHPPPQLCQQLSSPAPSHQPPPPQTQQYSIPPPQPAPPQMQPPPLQSPYQQAFNQVPQQGTHAQYPAQPGCGMTQIYVPQHHAPPSDYFKQEPLAPQPVEAPPLIDLTPLSISSPGLL